MAASTSTSAAALAASAACGLVNGLLITRLRVVPFIVTLGTMLIVRGMAKGLADERRVEAPMTWLNDLLRASTGTWALPSGIWLVVFFGVLVAVLLQFTRLGRHIFAIGSNERMARLCGVPIDRTNVIVYTLNAALAGLAGVLQFSKLAVGDPTVAVGLELDVIAAVIIGGASLNGGVGTVLGSMIGALIMAVLRNGSQQMGWPTYFQEIIIGLVIIVAVFLDRVRQGRSSA